MNKLEELYAYEENAREFFHLPVLSHDEFLRVWQNELVHEIEFDPTEYQQLLVGKFAHLFSLPFPLASPYLYYPFGDFPQSEAPMLGGKNSLTGKEPMLSRNHRHKE